MSIRASTVIMKPRSLSTLHVGLMPSIVPRRRITFRRHHSTKPGFDDIGSKSASSAVTPSMARLPTKLILRSLVLTSLMSSKLFLRPSLAALDIITNSKSAILNPDRNRILNKILRWTVYDQFCAGTNRQEVSKAVADIKKIGYQGVILGYSKEIIVDPIDAVVRDGSGSKIYSDRCYDMVEEWKKGTLNTLRMVGPGDYLAVKLTGASPICIDAMAERKPMPAVVARAMDEICLATREQGSRLWLDAEQQVLQHGLDDWAIGIMKKHNKSGPPLVYNTIQAYLKGSKSNLDRHLTLASEGGFGVGVKLVRGAYIEHEMRSLIHDTKEETDQSYDLLADAMICRRMPEGSKLDFPNAALFLATHNAASAAKAIIGHQKRLLANKPVIRLECGQIQGMADELSCELVQNYERALEQSTEANVPVPKAFKCMVWGSVAECMQYLHRRSIENKGAVERTQHMVTALKEELRRRIFG